MLLPTKGVHSRALAIMPPWFSYMTAVKYSFMYKNFCDIQGRYFAHVEPTD